MISITKEHCYESRAYDMYVVNVVIIKRFRGVKHVVSFNDTN